MLKIGARSDPNAAVRFLQYMRFRTQSHMIVHRASAANNAQELPDIFRQDSDPL